ncbi:7-cyano-7-deazaguanine synthase QueC [Streptomyces sp. NPDC049879]|uniref:7-cyano-7-deazaguanine synthase QueC n=1 Tax=Streptomyces sp. NPDC049879 TaxID=3365598 RepID=UPI0037A0D9AF
MTRTTALVSGGLDSAVMAAQLVDDGHVVTALSVDYGQRHRRELDAARAVAGALGISHVVVDLTGVTAAMDPSSSALLGSAAMPHGHYSDASMAMTVVPGRNLLMIAAAAAVAASRGDEAVAIAAHAGDHPVYPDCRTDFLGAAAQAVSLGVPPLDVLYPFANMTKDRIVARGWSLGVPMNLTWSCYEGGAEHCGRCGTCVERAEAFVLAGVADPTTYADAAYAREVTGR